MKKATFCVGAEKFIEPSVETGPFCVCEDIPKLKETPDSAHVFFHRTVG